MNHEIKTRPAHRELRTLLFVTADRLAQLVEYRTTGREVVGSNPGRTNT